MAIPRILIIDDDYQFCLTIERDFKENFSIQKAKDMDFGRHYLDRETYDLLLFDLQLNKGEGYEIGLSLIPELRKKYSHVPLIVVSTDEKREDACLAGQNGASYFLWKGDYIAKKWEKVFLSVIEFNQLKTANTHLKTQNEALKTRLVDVENMAYPFIGNSESISKIKAELEAIGRRTDSTTILITGETGVGKEVAARYFHRVSTRHSQPFRTVPLSSMPSNLIENELFGHRKGAFTDAKEDKIGYFRQADKGVLFLDEIGDINYDVQLRLLRFLQDKIIRPVGSDTDIQLDIQTVAATNKDLREEMNNKRFRQDLFHRLNIFPVRIPPLRERASDIPLLLAHFLRVPVATIREQMAHDVYNQLMQYAWPGNIRELSATVSSMTLRRDMHDKKCIDMDCLPEDIREMNNLVSYFTPSVSTPFESISHDEKIAIADLERIEKALARSLGNKSLAAESLNMTADDLRYRVRKYAKSFPEDTKRYHHIIKAYLSK